MNPVGSFTVAADHPSLPGHFPGRPIVPGVVLLDRALTLILGEAAQPAGLPAVKFTRPVLPGQTVAVSCTAPQDGRIGFECSVAGAVVARGSVALG